MEYWHSVLHMITVNVEWFSLTYFKLLTINCWKLFSNLITAVMGCSLHRRLLSRTYIDLEIITLSCYNVLSPVQASSLLSADVSMPRLSPHVNVMKFQSCHYIWTNLGILSYSMSRLASIELLLYDCIYSLKRCWMGQFGRKSFESVFF